MFTLLLSLASAQAPPTVFLPSAAPSEGTSVSAGAMGVLAPEDPWGAGGAWLEASLAPTDRLAIELRLPTPLMVTMDPDLLGGRGGGLGGLLLLPMLSARYSVLQGEHFNLAPYAFAAGLASFSPSGGNKGGLMLLAGVAAEGGWERWRLDGSFSVAGYGGPIPGFGDGLDWDIWPWLAPAFLEVGVRWLVDEHHSLRLGMIAAVPTLSYRYTQPRWFAEGTVASVGFFNLGIAQAGFRF